MSSDNEDYWWNHWHEDVDLHKKMLLKNVEKIEEGTVVSVYGDSITGDSILNTIDGNMTIEELYNLSSDKSSRVDKEVVECNSSSLNWTSENGIHLSKIKNVIRHKVSKKKWKIKVGGNELILTNDHSLIIFRDGEKMEVKPSDVKGSDKILTYKEKPLCGDTGTTEYEIVEIESIEEIGEFNDEYVYDLEMDDESHTFIANNILVHNTDSIFVGFDPAIKSCDWQNNIFNSEWLNKCPHSYRILRSENLDIEIDNDNYKGFIEYNKGFFKYDGEEVETEQFPIDMKLLIIDGSLLKNYKLNDLIKGFEGRIVYNWGHEIEFIHGLDHYKISDYFKFKLTEHANKYGVENVEDFELEKIAESIINLEKKKYIQHIAWEDGIDYERFSYLQPKGVELVRSSTAQFARDKDMGIYRIVNYLFEHPDNFSIKELLQIIKEMRREFELAEINDISGQSSCSKYNEKVLNDTDRMEFVVGAHFAVKAAAHHNYILNKHKNLQTKYEFLKSGDKIKYYYTKDAKYPIFAFKRGEYPIEYAPDVDYDIQFDKVILSPVNNIIKKLGLPAINKRLSVIMDIFSGF